MFLHPKTQAERQDTTIRPGQKPTVKVKNYSHQVNDWSSWYFNVLLESHKGAQHQNNWRLKYRHNNTEIIQIENDVSQIDHRMRSKTRRHLVTKIVYNWKMYSRYLPSEERGLDWGTSTMRNMDENVILHNKSQKVELRMHQIKCKTKFMVKVKLTMHQIKCKTNFMVNVKTKNAPH